jgi:hypothetical protein
MMAGIDIAPGRIDLPTPVDAFSRNPVDLKTLSDADLALVAIALEEQRDAFEALYAAQQLAVDREYALRYQADLFENVA